MSRKVGICEQQIPIPGVILRCDKPVGATGRVHQEHHATYELADTIVHVWWKSEARP